jgi:hypothetical protein
MSEDKDFDALQTAEVTIERNGKSRTYLVTEFTKLDAQQAFNINKDNGKRDPVKARQVDSRLIARAVQVMDGNGGLTPITFAQAEVLPQSVSRKLVAAVLEINGIGGEDEDEKN